MGDKLSVASLVWDTNSQLHLTVGDIFEDLGYQHQFFRYDEAPPQDADFVFILGPYGGYDPFVKNYRAIPNQKRPVIVYWFCQNLMLDYPAGVLRVARETFSDLRAIDRPKWQQDLRNRVLKIFHGRGSRFASLGDIFWMKRRGLLGVLGVSASYYADYFHQQGVEAVLVPRGYHSSYGQLLNLDRDIAVTWMGKIRNRRRHDIIYGLKEQLNSYGLQMHIHDNESMPFIFGEERTEILNRSWFVVNVLAYPTDEISIRYYIAAANGAVVLTEPGRNRYPFENGKHLVECRVEEMAEKVVYYVNHPEEWQRISNAMYERMRREITLEKSIQTLMSRAESMRVPRV